MPMDWIALISRLRQRGWTQQGIAAEVGVTQPTVSELATGKARRPSFDVGAALKKLDDEARCPKGSPKAPAHMAKA